MTDCVDCGCRLTVEEKKYYGVRCERCERIAFDKSLHDEEPPQPGEIKIYNDAELLGLFNQQHDILNRLTTAFPIEDWHEELGDVLWWTFPIEEPPYCGSPLDTNWPGYHTHFTTFLLPRQIKPQQTKEEN